MTGPHRPKKGNSTVLVVGVGLVATLLLCGIFGVVILTAADKARQPTGTSGNQAEAAKPVKPTATQPVNPTPAAGSISDGTWEVPSEVKPGTYISTVPDGTFSFCVWERLSGFTGKDDTIALGTGNAGDRMRVVISPTDKGFETKGCGVWTKTA